MPAQWAGLLSPVLLLAVTDDLAGQVDQREPDLVVMRAVHLFSTLGLVSPMPQGQMLRAGEVSPPVAQLAVVTLARNVNTATITASVVMGVMRSRATLGMPMQATLSTKAAALWTMLLARTQVRLVVILNQALPLGGMAGMVDLEAMHNPDPRVVRVALPFTIPARPLPTLLALMLVVMGALRLVGRPVEAMPAGNVSTVAMVVMRNRVAPAMSTVVRFITSEVL